VDDYCSNSSLWSGCNLQIYTIYIIYIYRNTHRRSLSNYYTASASVEFWSRMIYDRDSTLEIFTIRFRQPMMSHTRYISSLHRQCIFFSQREELIFTRDVCEKNIKLHPNYWLSYNNIKHILTWYVYNTN